MKQGFTFIFYFIFSSYIMAGIPEQYIASYKHIAISEMNRTRIPASIILAQGMLESDFGRGELAKKANNHFGIKCGSNWDGNSYDKLDDDKNPTGTAVNSCFRVYNSVKDSYIDHSNFLINPQKQSRYGFLFEYDSDDYVSWAIGLKDAGYATDIHYAKKLIAIIDNYELYKYDKVIGDSNSIPQKLDAKIEIYKPTSIVEKKHTEIVTKVENKPSPKPAYKPKKAYKNKEKSRRSKSKKKRIGFIKKDKKKKPDSKNKVSEKYGLKCARLFEGDTPRLVAERYDMHVDRLLSYNKGYQADDMLNKGDVLYLEHKMGYYTGEEFYHIVKKGENLNSIAHKYGVSTRMLRVKNRIPKNAEPLIGERLNLKIVNIFHKPKVKKQKEKEEFLFD